MKSGSQVPLQDQSNGNIRAKPKRAKRRAEKVKLDSKNTQIEQAIKIMEYKNNGRIYL